MTSASAPCAQDPGRLLTKKELASYLGVTPRTVETYQPRGLPFFRLGPRRNRYDLQAVRRWLRRFCRDLARNG